MPAGTRVRLCGRLSIVIGDRDVVADLRGPQSRILLAFLILNRHRAVRREELCEAMWSAAVTDQPSRSALSVLLSRMRPAIAPGRIEGREAVALALPEPVVVDVEEARRALAGGEGGADVARRALALVAGGPAIDHDAPWVTDFRREVEQMAIDAQEQLVRTLLDRERDSAAAEIAARDLVAIAPFRESGWLALIEALEARGERSEALRTYERFRLMLREELGTFPGAALRAAHSRLVAAHEEDAPVLPVSPATDGDPPRVAAPDGHRGPPPVPALLAAARGNPFVGRQAALTTLGQAWEEAKGGVAAAVVVAGEPGVGKTRLAEEFGRQVVAEGGAVLYGRADEETAVPYEPWIEALTPWGHPVDGSGSPAGGRSGLDRLLPGASPQDGGTVRAGDSDEVHGDRFRLHQAVADVLVEVAARTPVLVLLDDLHWGDRPTLALLRHVVRAAATAPVLIVATVRAHHLSMRGVLADALADLDRMNRLRRLDLAGLAVSDVSTLIAELGEEPASPALAGEIHEATGGNPFFVSEIVRHLRATPVRGAVLDSVPPGIRDAVGHRIRSLDSELRQVLSTASVLSREFPLDVVAELSGLDESRALERLEEGVGAAVLVERADGSGRHTFAHPLLRSVVYEGLSATRRVRLHALALAALEARRDGADAVPCSELARHAVAAVPAGNRRAAVTWSRRAGEEADAQYAHDEAAEHYRRALELLDPSEGSGDERLELLVALGHSLARGGDMTRARPELERAAELAEARGDAEALTRAALIFAGPDVERFGVVDQPAIELLERSLSALPSSPSASRALALARLAVALYFVPGQAARIDALSRDAVAAARRSGDPSVLGTVLSQRHVALWRPDRLPSRLEVSAEALGHARQAGDRQAEVRALELRGLDLVEHGDLQGAVDVWDAHRRLAAVLRQPHMLLYAKVHETLEALAAGRLDVAEGLAAEAVALGEEDVSQDAVQFQGVHLLVLRREQDRVAELEPGVRAFAESYPTIPGWRAALALVLAEAGDHEAAAEQLELLRADRFSGLPRDINFLVACAFTTHAIVELGDVEAARDLHAALEPYGERLVPVGTIGAVWGSTEHFLGLLARTAGDVSPAVAHLERGLDMHRREGLAVWARWSELELAETLLDADPRRAAELLASARTTAEELRLSRLARRVRAVEDRVRR